MKSKIRTQKFADDLWSFSIRGFCAWCKKDYFRSEEDATTVAKACLQEKNFARRPLVSRLHKLNLKNAEK